MRRGSTRRAIYAIAVVSLLGVAAVAAATASTDTRGGAAASTVKVGFIYSRTGALSGFGAEELRGLPVRALVSQEPKNTCGGHKLSVTYVDDQTNPAERGHGGEGSDRPGLQDHRRLDLVGVGGAGRADRRPEQRPLHLRPGGRRRHHRAQPAHVPRGPPELPGRGDCGGNPAAEVRRQEDRRLRGRHGVRCEQLRGRPAGPRQQGSHGLEDPRAVPGRGPDAVRSAAQECERRPRLRRMGRLQLAGDVAGARPAEGAGHRPR